MYYARVRKYLLTQRVHVGAIRMHFYLHYCITYLLLRNCESAYITCMTWYIMFVSTLICCRCIAIHVHVLWVVSKLQV